MKSNVVKRSQKAEQRKRSTDDCHELLWLPLKIKTCVNLCVWTDKQTLHKGLMKMKDITKETEGVEVESGMDKWWIDRRM